MTSLYRSPIAFLLIHLCLVTSCAFPFGHRAPKKETPPPPKVIALLTDYGDKDFYVGALKGIIYSIHPEATVVDITHQISPYNIKEGALTLYHAAQEFPAGTIFVAVVDPGLGTEIKPLVVHTLDGKYFVGPDNGIFNLIFQEVGITKVYQIKNPTWMRQAGISKTFHGRDIFAPVAAHLAAGWPIEEVGPEIKDYLLLSLSPAKREGNRIQGEVTSVDHYGNVILNIPKNLIEELGVNGGAPLLVHIKGKKVKVTWGSTYSDVPEGKEVLLISSADFLELAVHRGNVAKKYGIQVGEVITIENLN